MASSNVFVNYLVLFIAILAGLFVVNIILSLLDSPFRISIWFSLILTGLLILVQYFTYRNALKNFN
jgi:hypothetical protein